MQAELGQKFKNNPYNSIFDSFPVQSKYQA
jgi:hypothetical protein